ncbi:MAG: glycosyltransferase family 87 protein [Planctomycetota bacterium]
MNSPDTHLHRRTVRFWIVASLAGLVLRLLFIPLSPHYGYLFDHDDLVRWGIQAADEGVLTLYDHPPPRWNIRCWHNDRWVITQRPFERVHNYPPLTAYLIYASGLVFRATSADRVINTVTSRLIFSCWGILGDLLLAWGCAALVALYRPERAAKWTYLLVLFAPPFWWDSVMWGQFDALLLAAGVWFVWAMLRRRWVSAGVLLGLAAALKPQALLLLPVWALAATVCSCPWQKGTGSEPDRGFGVENAPWRGACPLLPRVHRPRRQPFLCLASAGAVLLLLALPFTLHGGWTWWRLSYPETLLEKFPATTLNAFNVWYLDLLLCDSLDVTARWLGVTKEMWGRLFLLVGLVGGFAWVIRRWRDDPRAWVVWSTLVMLLSIMLPTRIHERYLLMVLPFLTVAAMVWRRFWPGLLVLLVVATCQITWPLWLREPAGGWENHTQVAAERHAREWAALSEEAHGTFPDLARDLELERAKYLQGRSRTEVVEWGVTLLALLGAVATVAAALSLRPRDHHAETSARRF